MNISTTTRLFREAGMPDCSKQEPAKPPKNAFGTIMSETKAANAAQPDKARSGKPGLDLNVPEAEKQDLAEEAENEITGEASPLLYLYAAIPESPEESRPQAEPVVSILEGNDKDTNPLQSSAAVPTPGAMPTKTEQTSAEEILARMPQMTGPSSETLQTKSEEIPNSAESDGLCPLENENDRLPEPLKQQEQTQKKILGAEDGVPNEAEVKKTSETSPAPRVIPVQQMVDISPEKLASTQQLSGAAGAVPVAPENLYDTMVERIEVMQSLESNQMDIQLKPDFLGKVSIRLSAGDEGLQVKIKAEDAGVKNLIGGQIDRLLESLTDKGIKIASIDVVYTGVSDLNYNQSGAKQNPTGQKASRGPEIDGIPDSGTLPISLWGEAEAFQIDTTISSVEYRA